MGKKRFGDLEGFIELWDRFYNLLPSSIDFVQFVAVWNKFRNIFLGIVLKLAKKNCI
jgi:hypothetical protein